jgi:putative transposase
MQELTHYAHSVAQTTYHLEWATKYRDDRFGSVYRRNLCECYLKLTARRHGIKVIAIRVLPEHVHMFVELRPSMSPSKALMLLKGVTSRMLKKDIKHFRDDKRMRHLWSPGKFIRTVGNVTSETIEKYIKYSSKNQYYKQHSLKSWT